MLMTLVACQKEEIPESSKIQFENQEAADLFESDYAQYQQYVKKHGEVTREIITLEEMEELIKEYDLEPLDQETINLYHSRDLSKATGACNSGWINFCGDHNRDGTFSTLDIIRFNQVCRACSNSPNACTSRGTLGCNTWNLPFLSPERTFGYLSWYDNGIGITIYNLEDRISARRMILGIVNC